MTLFSSHWYRIGPLVPRLRSTAAITRQTFRGKTWHVIFDQLSGRVFRLTPATHKVVGLMDGKRTVDQIWTLAAEHLGDDLPTQDELISLLGRLHQADLLVTNQVPDLDEIGSRRQAREHHEMAQKFKSPLSIRVPLFDPDRFLTRTLPYVAPLLSVWGLAAAGILFAVAVILVGLNWTELTHNLLDRVSAYNNVLLMLCVYPLVKAVHELGHAYAVKRWGGEVHEIGVLLLLFFPVPYVDATASVAWPEKWQRITVAAMGILVELVLASLALIIWLSVEPGLVSTIAFSVMVMAGISTLLFNGNPLLRFDGYYVFSDVIEIQNLGPRSNAFLTYLIKRYAFGVESATSPADSTSEGTWLAGYAIVAFAYRIAITFGIISYVADQFFIVGTLLAIMAAIQMAVLPLLKGAYQLAVGLELKRVRRRAITVTFATIAIIGALLTLVPVPYRGLAQGVVWVPEGARIVADGSGFINEVFVTAGERISPGREIMHLDNDELVARVKGLTAQVALFEARVAAEVKNGPAAVNQVRQQLDHARAALAEAKSRLAQLAVRSGASGIFVPAFEGEPRGRFVEKGQRLGYVLDPSQPTIVRLAVPEHEADLIRARINGLKVRLAERQDEVYAGRIAREVPAARDSLPSKALSTEGGGPFYLDPRDPDQLKSLERIFIFECEIDAPLPLDRVGGRVFARLDYGTSSLAEQLYRPLRQLVLRQLKI